MSDFPPPTGPPTGTPSGPTGASSNGLLRRAGRAYLRWPLWAKIGVPGALLVFGAVANATEAEPEPDTADVQTTTTVSDAGSINQLADLSGTTEPTPAPETTPAPTDPPTTTTPPTEPPTTPAPTSPPTEPPTTPAPTSPPTTKAPATTSPPTTQAPKTTPPPTTTSPPTTAAPALDPRYSTCKEAKAHGLGPYYQGQDPEYSWYRDADKDGIVCE